MELHENSASASLSRSDTGINSQDIGQSGRCNGNRGPFAELGRQQKAQAFHANGRP